MGKLIFTSFIFIIIFSGCSSDDTGVGTADPSARLQGSWTDDYTLAYMPEIGIPEDPHQTYDLPLTSTMTFDSDTFAIAVHIQTSAPIFQVQYCSGRYHAAGDTLILMPQRAGFLPPDSNYFRFHIRGRQLLLQEIPQGNGGLVSIHLISLPWQYGNPYLCVSQKNQGTFARPDNLTK
jgi:hypothetical protein